MQFLWEYNMELFTFRNFVRNSQFFVWKDNSINQLYFRFFDFWQNKSKD